MDLSTRASEKMDSDMVEACRFEVIAQCTRGIGFNISRTGMEGLSMLMEIPIRVNGKTIRLMVRGNTSTTRMG